MEKMQGLSGDTGIPKVILDLMTINPKTARFEAYQNLCKSNPDYFKYQDIILKF